MLGAVAIALTFVSGCASGANATDPPPSGDQGGTGGSDTGAGGDSGTGGDSTGTGGGSAGPMGMGAGGGAGFPATGGSSPGKGGSAGASGKGGVGGAAGGAAGAGVGGADSLPAGSPCTTGSQCQSTKCVDTGHTPNLVCVDPCKTGAKCAMGTHCTTIGGAPVCIPDRDSECGICVKDADCKNQGDRCLSGAAGEKYCAQDCGYDGNCPTGYDCKAVPMGNPGDKACVPTAAAACPCGPNRDGATRACTNMNASFTCTGSEKCDGKMAKYTGCTAAMPPAVGMCAAVPMGCMSTAMGGFPHAMCTCGPTGCTLLCDMGFSHYPTSLPDSAGCPCSADPGEPSNDTCAAATKVAAIADGGTASIKISGTLSADTDVDWYDIAIGNMPGGGTNPHHVSITFDANPGNEFLFVALRGGDCTKAATAPSLTSYDWCVNYSAAGVGEAPCGDGAGLNTCTDHSSPYKIGVMRSAMAAAKTCTAYSLTVNAAAGACVPASIDACGMMP